MSVQRERRKSPSAKDLTIIRPPCSIVKRHVLSWCSYLVWRLGPQAGRVRGRAHDPLFQANAQMDHAQAACAAVGRPLEWLLLLA
jgi:hypothetical protein